MAAGQYNILIEQGSTFSRQLLLKKSDGTPLDLSDVTSVVGQVRKTYGSTPSFAFTLAVLDAAAGTISWTMSATITASIPVNSLISWLYDINLVSGSVVQRILQGTATISPEVTQ